MIGGGKQGREKSTCISRSGMMMDNAYQGGSARPSEGEALMPLDHNDVIGLHCTPKNIK
jgi:hypothetical protein